MTVSSSNRKAGPYACNGATVTFSFSFKVFQSSDVKVVHTDAALVETTLDLNSDYSVSLNADQNANPGGSITTTAMTYPTGDLITITSAVINTQPTDIVNQGGFYPSVIEDALDRTQIQLQQVAEGLSRAVQVPISSATTPESYLSTAQAAAISASASASSASASASAAASSASTASSSAAVVANWAYTGAWLTATAYLKNQIVLQGGTSYICLVAHTSGTFATDYAAAKWGILAQQGTSGTGSGDMLAANNLSDVADVATARANLGAAALASPTFTGTPAAPTAAAATNTNQIATTAMVQAAIAAAGTAGFTTGDVKPTLKTTADSGWVMMNDGTIGNAASGATTRANADTSALFTLLWNNVSNTYCAVSSGRGASAAADFAANKTIALPKALGRSLCIAGAGSGLTSRALGLINGEESHTLSITEIPAHTHTMWFTNDGSASNQTYANTTATGSATTYESTGSAGGGAPHNNMQPSFFLNIMIKL